MRKTKAVLVAVLLAPLCGGITLTPLFGAAALADPLAHSAQGRLAVGETAGCHNQPIIGGAGAFVVNVFVLAQVLDPVSPSIRRSASRATHSACLAPGRSRCWRDPCFNHSGECQ